MEDWKFGPPVLIGERVVWVKNSAKEPESGVVRWIGKLSKESADWTVGIELDNVLPFGDGTNGCWGDRKLFDCDSRRGVFLPLSRIRKEGQRVNPRNHAENSGEEHNVRSVYNGGSLQERKLADRSSKWINEEDSITQKNQANSSSDTDDTQSEIFWKSVRHRKKNKSPKGNRKKDDFHNTNPRKCDPKRPFSITGRINDSIEQSKDKSIKKHESCALEEKYIREFIQREIRKQQEDTKSKEKAAMNDVKGNFKRIDEDDITRISNNNVEGVEMRQAKTEPIGRRLDAFHRREKSNGFFSFLKWFKKSKEMPELECPKDSSVTSSPLFVRRRSSSCGSVDTLFSIATANSFAFVSPVQYQAVISSSHTAYPVPNNKSDDESRNKNQSDYENNPVKNDEETMEKRKKSKAPEPPRDSSLPNTLEHRKSNDDDDSDGKSCHRRTVSESFKDKKAGYYCHVQGKRKAPLPPATTPLYPSLTSLKSQCPSISKKKRPAPPPPDGKPKEETAKPEDNILNYDNVPYLNQKINGEPSLEKPILKSSTVNLSPILGINADVQSSPLPSRPWYKRSSSGSNILKKESIKFGDRKKNKENEEWMPEVGFSRRPISNEGHNIFNLLARLDRNPEKKKEEKRKSQISILANISELDREAAEIVRKEHAQEKKLMADKDEKYYSSFYDNNILSSFPNISSNALEVERQMESTMKSPFDEFKPRKHEERKINAFKREESDANEELDYYINPWNCPKCTLENPGWEKFCEACNTKRVKFRSNVEVPKKPQTPILRRTKSEEVPEKSQAAEIEDPAEDNLEGVRKKRLAFFTSKQGNIPDQESEVEKEKLKIMLKEMKNSLPKRDKGVINNVNEASLKDDPQDNKTAVETTVLDSREQEAGDGAAASKKFPKVQQTLDGSGKKESEIAEAIVITKTTVFEDIIVKKTEKEKKVSASVQTNATIKGDLRERKPNVAKMENTCANEQKKVLDFTENTIEAVNAKLQKEGEGSVDCKVNVQGNTWATTLDVNRLLKTLEDAISSGRHLEAATIAKELAKMKVSCSVNRQKLVPQGGLAKIIVDLYVEDKKTHKGPIKIQVLPTLTLAQLKMKVEKEWDIPRDVQRWILGKQLATDDRKTLQEHGVVNSTIPLFLYLVTPETPGESAGEKVDRLRNVPEPKKPERRNGKVPYPETRRPSLIIEEESEIECEEPEEKPPIQEKDTTDVKIESKEGRSNYRKLSAPEVRVKESAPRRASLTTFSIEKREMNEDLKKELKVISANSVKDRIEKLYRAAASGSVNEGSETSGYKSKNESRPEPNKQKRHYNELMQLENADLVTNTEEFECPVCLVPYGPGEGVVLKDCLHIFCRPCLVNTVQFNEEAEVKCPYRDDKYSCESVLQQREIKSLVPKGLFEQHLAKSVSVAENNIGNAYHCKTPDCKGWCILEDNVNEFRCPVCKITNCLTCQSIHTGMNCRQYQEQLEFASDTNVDAKKTRDMLQEMVEKGEAMACPTCQVVLMKKWGCDWLRCSMCKTEICWVTRGPRWGPGGKGDTSGGCQCGVNGVKCHPKCNYCH